MGYMKNGWQANVTGCCLPTSALNYTLHVSHHMIRLVSVLILKIINPFLFLPFLSLPFHSFPSFPFPLFLFPSPPSLLSLSPPLLCHSLHPSAIHWLLWQRGLHHDPLSHSFFPSLQTVKKRTIHSLWGNQHLEGKFWLPSSISRNTNLQEKKSIPSMVLSVPLI